MTHEVTWFDITLRLFLAMAASALIGFDRSEQGRPAGLRTTVLVCLAATVAMIQANLMLTMKGRSVDSFMSLDVMRLPLGILSGMGFIGAGAIMKQEKSTLGVTTAATLWFVTVMGLCFGAGQIGLGLAMVCLGFITLVVLRRVDDIIKRDRRAKIKIVLTPDGPSEQRIRDVLLNASFKILSLGVTYCPAEKRLVHCVVEWRGYRTETNVPNVIELLAGQPGISRIQWQP